MPWTTWALITFCAIIVLNVMIVVMLGIKSLIEKYKERNPN